MDKEELRILCTDDEGNPIYLISQTTINGRLYFLVTPDEDFEENEDADLFLLRDCSEPEDGDELVVETVEDEDEIESVGKIFQTILAEDGIDLEIV